MKRLTSFRNTGASLLLLTLATTTLEARADAVSNAFVSAVSGCLPSARSPGAPLKIKPMESEFARRDRELVTIGRLTEPRVRYLPPEDTKKYRLQIRDGLILNAQGTPWSGSVQEFGPRMDMYVLTPEKELYWMNFDNYAGSHRHSSIPRGGPVAMAGEFSVKEGRLNWISNASGHYKPGHDLLEQMVEFLFTRGVPLERTMVYFTPDKIAAKEELMGTALQYLFRSEESRNCLRKISQNANLSAEIRQKTVALLEPPKEPHSPPATGGRKSFRGTSCMKNFLNRLLGRPVSF